MDGSRVSWLPVGVWCRGVGLCWKPRPLPFVVALVAVALLCSQESNVMGWCISCNRGVFFFFFFCDLLGMDFLTDTQKSWYRWCRNYLSSPLFHGVFRPVPWKKTNRFQAYLVNPLSWPSKQRTWSHATSLAVGLKDSCLRLPHRTVCWKTLSNTTSRYFEAMREAICIISAKEERYSHLVWSAWVVGDSGWWLIELANKDVKKTPESTNVINVFRLGVPSTSILRCIGICAGTLRQTQSDSNLFVHELFLIVRNTYCTQHLI